MSTTRPEYVAPRGPADADYLILCSTPLPSEAYPAGKAWSGSIKPMAEEIIAPLKGTVRVEYVWPFHCARGAGELFQDKKWMVPTKELAREIQCKKNALDSLPYKGILLMGDLALYTFNGETSVHKWRGSRFASSQGTPVVPTYALETLTKAYDWKWITQADVKRLANASPDDTVPFRVFRTAPDSIGQALCWVAQLEIAMEAGNPIVCDVETLYGFIECIGFATSSSNAYCFPLMSKNNHDGYWTAEEEIQLLLALRPIIQYAHLAGQNFNYDWQFTQRQFIVPKPARIRDSMLEWHLLYPGTRKSLDFLASILCEHYVYWKDDLSTYREYPAEESVFWNYNCLDCIYTYEVLERTKALIKRFNLQTQLAEQYDDWFLASEMQNHGMLADTKAAEAEAERFSLLEHEYVMILDRIIRPALPDSLASKTPVWDSPRNLNKFLYDVLGVKRVLHKVTKRPSVDDDAIQVISRREPALAAILNGILTLRSIRKFRADFCEARTFQGRHVTQYNVAGPETFRWSASKTPWNLGNNAQTIPKGD